MRNEALIHSIVRAHAWMQTLRDGKHESIEALAEANRLHPKVVFPLKLHQRFKKAGSSGLSFTQIPKLLPLHWTEHRRLLG